MPSMLTLAVDRADLRASQVIEQPLPDLTDGQVLVHVDRFALTANNITYAETGDSIGYWGFFPGPAGWGVIPVWGFAEVVASRCDGVAAGQRFYGFWPAGSHLVLQPQRVGGAGFVDGAPHRQALPAAYNRYLLTGADASYRPEDEDLIALLRPMFVTSFLIDDFLDDEGFFGARQVVISSASAKTAFGLAFLLKRRGTAEVIGLTSASNRAFVAGLGCYDQVVAYDDLTHVPSATPAVYVDFAGSAELRHRVHAHWGDRLVYSSAVGLAHRDLGRAKVPAAGVKPVFFFAPDRLRKRAQDWGRDGIEPRLAEQWRPFVGAASGWLAVTHDRGSAAVQAAYAQALAGQVPPSVGVVLSMD
ncbi:DUF2855 family protein [Ideonella sp. DXS29W]|uniref:DUF2855 family protein n=1 Tax=Ideonella lacteola TaxID=2984193 RepID=A0ABU9BUQ2_9BURK